MEPATGAVDSGAMLAQAQTQMQEQLQMQMEMQTMSNEHNTQSSLLKMNYETEKSSIQRLEKIADSVTALTDQQTQAIQ